MARWYVLASLLPALAVPESIQELIGCSDLGKYAFPTTNPGAKESLLLKFLFYELDKDTDVSLVYSCALEGVGGLILEEPEKPITCLEDLGLHSLVFEANAIKDGVDSVEKLNDAAIDLWKKQIAYLVKYATAFGCNYRRKYERYSFLCLLELKTGSTSK